MSIPDQITLAGITIDIVDVPGMAKDRKLIGEARYQEQVIAIDKTAASPDILVHTFWHEKVHYILYLMNEDELRNNEKFVDMFSLFLHQAVKSAIYHKKEEA